MSAVSDRSFAERFAAIAEGLSDAELDGLSSAFLWHEAAAGEALVSQATFSDELFLVWDGALDITVPGPDEDHHLATLGPGSLFGDVALLDPGPAGATVSTEQGATVLRMSRARFDQLAGEHPPAAASLLGEAVRALAARMRAARGHLEQLGGSAVPGVAH
jgi:SulP family sulfate permease